MSGKRQPTDVVEARGKKHLSRQETAERRNREVRPNQPVKRLRAPDWLPRDLQPQFTRLGRQLVELMPTILIHSDADTLAQYVIVQRQWRTATDHLTAVMATGDMVDQKELAAWSGTQSKLFGQARALAQDMGLTITSRCQLVVPRPEEEPGEGNPFLALIRGGAAADG